MSFGDEWDAEKTAVAMRLNQADRPGGSTTAKGSADHVAADDELGDIGHAAYGLFNGLESGASTRTRRAIPPTRV